VNTATAFQNVVGTNLKNIFFSLFLIENGAKDDIALQVSANQVPIKKTFLLDTDAAAK
jgi:hypothetical protein